MKILMVNKFLYPRGGAESYMFSLSRALEEAGHEVQFFGMYDEKNTVVLTDGIHMSISVILTDGIPMIIRISDSHFRIRIQMYLWDE